MKYNLQTEYYGEEIEDRSTHKVFMILAGILAFVFIFFLAVDLSFQNKYKFIYISGQSMAPTLNPNPVKGGGQDGVFIRLTQDVTYGDIIVHTKGEGDDATSVIKRVVGLEGDCISVARVPVEGYEEEQIRLLRVRRGSNQVEVVEEDYINNKDNWGMESEFDGVTYGRYFYDNNISKNQTVATYNYNGRDIKFVVIPEGKVFYMGDNRANSVDCRERGPALVSQIEGKVVKIAHNVYSFNNSPFWLFNYVGSYLSLVWDEIISFFAF